MAADVAGAAASALGAAVVFFAACFLDTCFFMGAAGLAMASAGATTAAGAALAVSLGAAGAWAKDAMANVETRAAAIRVLKLVINAFMEAIVALAPTTLSKPKLRSGLYPQRCIGIAVDPYTFLYTDAVCRALGRIWCNGLPVSPQPHQRNTSGISSDDSTACMPSAIPA